MACKFILIVCSCFCFSSSMLAQQEYCKPIIEKAYVYLKNKSIDGALEMLKKAEICDYKNYLLKERQKLQDSIYFTIKQQKAAAVRKENAIREILKKKEQAEREAAEGRKKNEEEQKQNEYEAFILGRAFWLHVLATDTVNSDPSLAMRVEYNAGVLLDTIRNERTRELFKKYFMTVAEKIYTQNPIYSYYISTGDSITSAAFSGSDDIIVTTTNEISQYNGENRYSTFDSIFPSKQDYKIIDNSNVVFSKAESKIYSIKGNIIKNFKTHTPTTITISTDGKTIITSKRDTLFFWNYKDSIYEKKCYYDTTGFSKVIISPNGKRALACTDSNLFLINTETRDTLSRIKSGNPIKTIAFSNDGEAFIINSRYNSAILYKINNDKIYTKDPVQFIGHSDQVNIVAFSPDGTTIITGSSDKTARTWNLRGEQLEVFKHPKPVNFAAFSPNGETIMTAEDLYIKIWSLRVFPLKEEIKKPAEPHDTLYAINATNIIWVDYNTMAKIETILPINENVSIQTPEQGKGKTKKTKEPEEPQKIIKQLPKLRIIKFSESREKMIFCVNDNQYFVWDVKKKTLPLILSEFKENDIPVDATFSNNSRYIALGDWDGTLYLWDTENGKLIKRKKHTALIKGIAFSPSDTAIVTASGDWSAILWNINGEKLMSFEHRDEVTAPAFSPDEKFLVTGCYDFNVYMWKIESGKLHSLMPEPGRYIWGGLSVSKDNRYVLTPFKNLYDVSSREKVDNFNRPITSLGYKKDKVIFIGSNSYWYIPESMKTFMDKRQLKDEQIKYLLEYLEKKEEEDSRR